MILLDVNVLNYAAELDAPQHEKSLAWLRESFEGPEPIGFPWQTISAFLRITTDRRMRSAVWKPEESLDALNRWLAQPGVVIVQPGPNHLALLEKMIIKGQAIGPLVSDAVLAALAIENGATLASTDRDFSRFPGLKWVNPLD
jgi:toxin-antitoxin system PIN domain toxin